MPERFDVIVVGAGLAGLSAAYTMARQGMTVVVLERGDHPGSKNVMSDIFYRQPAKQVFAECWKDAPFERPIAEHKLWVLAGESLLTGADGSAGWIRPHERAYSVLRGQFDAWLGQQVSGAGALIVSTATVLELLRDGRGQVIGARINRPEGDLLADIVILADGANALLGERMGLHGRRHPDQLALMVKEVLVPPGRQHERAHWIEQRFDLSSGQGLTIEIFSALPPGMIGKAVLNTNKDTLSFGISVLLSDLLAGRVPAQALLQAAKAHPVIAPLLDGCVPSEYCAHLLPDGSSDTLPPCFGPGVLVAGDAAQLGSSLHGGGANLAIISGKLAGETALSAHAKNDFSRQTLAAYESKLRESREFKEWQRIRKATKYLLKHRQLFSSDPAALNGLVGALFTLDSAPQRDRLEQVWKMAGGKMRLALDLWGLSKVAK